MQAGLRPKHAAKLVQKHLVPPVHHRIDRCKLWLCLPWTKVLLQPQRLQSVA